MLEHWKNSQNKWVLLTLYGLTMCFIVFGGGTVKNNTAWISVGLGCLLVSLTMIVVIYTNSIQVLGIEKSKFEDQHNVTIAYFGLWFWFVFSSVIITITEEKISIVHYLYDNLFLNSGLFMLVILLVLVLALSCVYWLLKPLFAVRDYVQSAQTIGNSLIKVELANTLLEHGYSVHYTLRSGNHSVKGFGVVMDHFLYAVLSQTLGKVLSESNILSVEMRRKKLILPHSLHNRSIVCDDLYAPLAAVFAKNNHIFYCSTDLANSPLLHLFLNKGYTFTHIILNQLSSKDLIKKVRKNSPIVLIGDKKMSKLFL
jgi:hypothetical protein